MRLNSEYALASAVRAARKQAGLSQQQVADLAGMSRVWVARLEGGEANVTLDSLLRVASVLGMSLEATWNPAAAGAAKLPKKRALKRGREAPRGAERVPSKTPGRPSTKASNAKGSTEVRPARPASGRAASSPKVGTTRNVKGSNAGSSSGRKVSKAGKVSLDEVLSRVTKK